MFPNLPWPQLPLTLLAAVTAGWVGVLCRYRGKGRPFGSRGSAAWAVAVVAVTSAAATVVGLTLPQEAAHIPPASVGVVLPMLLCASRAVKPEASLEHPQWYGIATLGVALLLDRLEQRMSADRDIWCESRLSPEWSLDELEEAAWELHAALARRTHDGRRLSRLRSDFDAVSDAVARAGRDSRERDRRRARHEAEQALIMMLGRAWDWGYSGIPGGAAAMVVARRQRVSSRLGQPRANVPWAGPAGLLGTSSTRKRASSAVHTAARVRNVRFSSPDRICETLPGVTPIRWASSRLVTPCSDMYQVTAVVSSLGSRAASYSMPASTACPEAPCLFSIVVTSSHGV